MGELTRPRPLAAHDDRHGFDCGRESLNIWLRRHAWHNQVGDVSRTSVVCEAESGILAGFVALSLGEIARAHLPKSAQRNRPDPIPVMLLGQLAVDRRFHGQGIAAGLMGFALRTALRISTEIGCWGILTHPLDEEVRRFYGKFGFSDLPSDPRRGMVVRLSDLRASGFQ